MPALFTLEPTSEMQQKFQHFKKLHECACQKIYSVIDGNLSLDHHTNVLYVMLHIFIETTGYKRYDYIHITKYFVKILCALDNTYS